MKKIIIPVALILCFVLLLVITENIVNPSVNLDTPGESTETVVTSEPSESSQPSESSIPD